MASELHQLMQERDSDGLMKKFGMTVIEPEEWAVTHIARNIRVADRIELWLAHRVGPLTAIQDSVAMQGLCGVYCHNGVPFAIGGVAQDIQEGHGVPWLLATDDIVKCGRGFAACSRLAQEVFNSRFRYLANFVHSRNHLSIRWLKWLGYKVDAEQIDIGDGKFKHFKKEN